MTRPLLLRLRLRQRLLLLRLWLLLVVCSGRAIGACLACVPGVVLLLLQRLRLGLLLLLVCRRP